MRGVAYCEAIKADIVIEYAHDQLDPVVNGKEGEILTWLQTCAEKVAASLNENANKIRKAEREVLHYGRTL